MAIHLPILWFSSATTTRQTCFSLLVMQTIRSAATDTPSLILLTAPPCGSLSLPHCYPTSPSQVHWDPLLSLAKSPNAISCISWPSGCKDRCNHRPVLNSSLATMCCNTESCMWAISSYLLLHTGLGISYFRPLVGWLSQCPSQIRLWSLTHSSSRAIPLTGACAVHWSQAQHESESLWARTDTSVPPCPFWVRTDTGAFQVMHPYSDSVCLA